MRWVDYAGSMSRAFTQTLVRRAQRRFDTRSHAFAACVVDFKRQKKDQRGLKGRSLVTVSPICSAFKFRARDDRLQDAMWDMSRRKLSYRTRHADTEKVKGNE
jgi:hypothetical protein